MAITFEPAQPKYRAALESLLASSNLPTEDLPQDLAGFTLALDNDRLIGSSGLVVIGPYGLLRSVAVLETYRKLKIGERLYHSALEIARDYAIREVWLITTTADRYFEKHGFERVVRTDVPPEIRAIPQFTSLCADSAIVMRRLLSNA